MESSVVERGLHREEEVELAGEASGRDSLVKVKVLLFARARELAGVPELEMELAAGLTTDECVAVVVERFPALQAVQEAMVLALNQAYVREPLVLKDGDELAFIPPISGG
eukprot:TRINITY_DN21557_c0_g1_i1.p1 TRINITY_DN21557_c0_g1~~TRINITY_DN21557_c0_g1_i1.p1  ORF type:complete len:110 (-),score=31.96 TRINITY_DN21557_c0_g1_i1:95-424(-)